MAPIYEFFVGETVTIVGDHDPAMLKYFDCTRSGPRSAFDSNVVYQFEIMEYVCEFAFVVITILLYYLLVFSVMLLNFLV